MWTAGFALVVAFTVAVGGADRAVDLPLRLSDAEFWRLVEDISEPDGYFDSDNLVSNEDTFQTVIPALAQSISPGGVYLGVGPEQNFSYMLAVSPKLAFIVDVRRGNLDLHLMYKALIELSADRVDFLSRLFARHRPTGLGPHSSVRDLFGAFAMAEPDPALREANLRAIIDHLITDSGFALSAADVAEIGRVYARFVVGGPRLRFVSSRPGNWYPTYEELQVATDGQGVARGYLATEDQFRRLRELHQANVIIPVVGNFAGPTALRSIGEYLKARDAAVSVFYTSNVERYLFRDGLWRDFMANVESLPLESSSTFIRSCFDTCSSPGGSRSVTLLDSMAGLLADLQAGRVRTYSDVLYHSSVR